MNSVPPEKIPDYLALVGDTSNGQRIAIERERFADDRRVPVESALPESVAQDDHRAAARRFDVAAPEQTAGGGPDTEYVEVAECHKAGKYPFGARLGTQADRLEIHHTPKHGSWLNMAEIELSVLGRECLDRRIAQRPILAREIDHWTIARNRRKRSVNWQFTTVDARIKLRRLYPSLHN